MSRPLARAVGPRTAVVLVHGYLGVLANAVYWRRCRAFLHGLEQAGYGTLVAKLPPTRDIIGRSARLRLALRELKADRLILVGHSMGGLDARYYAQALDHEARVAAVITLGTPHRGSVLAHWAMQARGILPFLARRLDRGALYQLTPEVAKAFNEHVRDRRDVLYISVAAARPPGEMPAVLRRFAAILQQLEGANDGMVSLHSARWGQRRLRVRADHFELIGWSLRPANEATERPLAHLELLRSTFQQALRA